MSELSVKDFNSMIVNILEKITNEVVLENPSGASVFPCLVIRAPLRFDEKTGETSPILSRFSIIVEAWTKKKSSSYELSDKVDKKLREYNFTRTGTPIDLHDEITKSYRYGGNYEVFFNALNNSLEKVK